MIGTSFGEWLFIRLSILFFRYTALLYLVFLVVFLSSSVTTAWRLFGLAASSACLIAEGVFFAVVWRPYQAKLKEHAVHPPVSSHEERRALFYRCFNHVEFPEAYLRGWFLGAEIRDIRRDNIREFLLWAFFDRDDSLHAFQDPGDIRDVEDFIQHIELAIGRKFEPGRGPAKSLRLTLDEIETTYRSLLWYVVILMIDQLTHLLLLWKGFKYYSGSAQSVFPPRPQCQWFLNRHHSPVPNLGYWYSPHASKETVPLVFFHGIGVGLLVYVDYLTSLLSSRGKDMAGTGIIALELLPISFRLTSPPPSKTEFLHQITRILEHHKWENFALVSHSYGSVLVTHMLSSPALQKRVQALVLIDPVTIMLHLPDVAYNFTRRVPKEANHWQLWYFASTDPGVAYCLGRHFFWRQNIVWREDLVGVTSDEQKPATRRVVVSLSGRDLITKPGVIAQYLEAGAGSSGEVHVIVFPRLDHAQVFDAPAELKRIVDLTTLCCAIPKHEATLQYSE